MNQPRRGGRRLTAAAILALTFAAPPLLLDATLGSPAALVTRLLESLSSSTAVVDALGFCGYLLWIYTSAVLMVELWQAVRGRALITRGGRPGIARMLVGTALAITPVAQLPGAVGAISVASGLAPASAPVAPSTAGGPQTTTVTITPNGPITLWRLAETYLGRGDLWQEIWSLNAGRVQADGSVMRDPGLLRVGWSVVVPTASASQVRVHPGTP